MVCARQAVPAPSHLHDEPYRPEKTARYRMIQENLETFHPQVDMEAGQSLPEFVSQEFEAYFQCGVLAHGLLIFFALSEGLGLRCPLRAWGNSSQEKLICLRGITS